jgi:hypothetical protein
MPSKSWQDTDGKADGNSEQHKSEGCNGEYLS